MRPPLVTTFHCDCLEAVPFFVFNNLNNNQALSSLLWQFGTSVAATFVWPGFAQPI